MEKGQLKLEDLFRQSFDGHQIKPPDSLWNKINFRLNLKQFFKADFGKFNVYYSSLIIGLVTSAFIYLSSGDATEIKKRNQNISKTITNPINKDIKKSNNDSKEIVKTEVNTSKNTFITGNSREIISTQISFSEEKDCTILYPLKKQNINQLIINDNDTIGNYKSILPVKPKPLFTIASREGCVPFELKLKNYTTGAVNYYWSFGDGGTSDEQLPEYTYNYPGVYKIQLKTMGYGGTAISIIDSIIVHDKPIIKALRTFESDVQVGEKISIPVESENADRFEWDFGDGSMIYKKLAEYSYKSSGDYSIILRSWSDFGCYDSLKVADINVIKNTKRIEFPNAFCPNPDGPSNGSYSEREMYFDVFHPKVLGNLSEYKLVIYSKAGMEVFRSNDIKIGWDGYYEKKLVPEGVYPYISSGKFDNGEKFLKKGNITILYRKK